MKKKIIIVGSLIYMFCFAFGGIWSRYEGFLMRHTDHQPDPEIRQLQNLYEAGLFDEVLSACDRADQDQSISMNTSQALYIRWAASQRLNRVDQASRVQERFLKEFPTDPLGAEMRFSNAVAFFAKGDDLLAKSELLKVEIRYPKTRASRKASQMLLRLETDNSGRS